MYKKYFSGCQEFEIFKRDSLRVMNSSNSCTLKFMNPIIPEFMNHEFLNTEIPEILYPEITETWISWILKSLNSWTMKFSNPEIPEFPKPWNSWIYKYLNPLTLILELSTLLWVPLQPLGAILTWSWRHFIDLPLTH